MKNRLFLILYFLLVPAAAYAWGPLTHIYLGNELLSFGSLLPAGLFEIIRKHRKDFIYGNLMADIIIGKKYLPRHKNPHSWDVAFDLMKAARNEQQKSFVYGYMSHLAADTIAHNFYTADTKNIGHTVMEMKADCLIDKKYWIEAMAIDRKVQARNDVFLESSLDPLFFSFKTNKRIFKSAVIFSVLSQERIGDFIDKNIATTLPQREAIEVLHRESLDKMLDFLQNGDTSEAVKLNPGGPQQKSRIAGVLFS